MEDVRGASFIGVVAVGLTLSLAGEAAPPGKIDLPSPDVLAKAPECAPIVLSGQKQNLWETAKHPALSKHCSLVMEGVRKFREARFLDAIDYAQKAEELAPGAGPWVVRGSAYARWGKQKEAVEAFEKAKSISARALDDAETLDDYGAALVQIGRLEDARKAFRALLPRVTGPQGLCGARPQCDAAGRAYLTAGLLAMDEGPKSLDEAIAILREARAKSDPIASDIKRFATLVLALALDRRGDVDQARELADEVAKGRGVPTEIPPEAAARFPEPEEGFAARAIGYEVSEPAAAIDAWKSYLSHGGDKRPFAAHAKQHLAALEKPGAKPKAKPKP